MSKEPDSQVRAGKSREAIRHAALEDAVYAAAIELQCGPRDPHSDMCERVYAAIRAQEACRTVIRSGQETWVLRLQKVTHVVEFSPSCPCPYLVRLPGKSAVIDKISDRTKTTDAIGCGKTLEEAAENAFQAQQTIRTEMQNTPEPTWHHQV